MAKRFAPPLPTRARRAVALTAGGSAGRAVRYRRPRCRLPLPACCRCVEAAGGADVADLADSPPPRRTPQTPAQRPRSRCAQAPSKKDRRPPTVRRCRWCSTQSVVDCRSGARWPCKLPLSDAAVAYRADQQHVEVTPDGSASVTFTGESGRTARRLANASRRGACTSGRRRRREQSGPAGWQRDSRWVGKRDGTRPVPRRPRWSSTRWSCCRSGKLQTTPLPPLEAAKLLQGDIAWLAFSRTLLPGRAGAAGRRAQRNCARGPSAPSRPSTAQLLFPPQDVERRTPIVYCRPQGHRPPSRRSATRTAPRRRSPAGSRFVALPMLQALRVPAPLHRQLRRRDHHPDGASSRCSSTR